MTPSQLEATIYQAWDFAAPAASREIFKLRAESAESEATHQIWQTQVGRTHGLENDFAHARKVLNEVEARLAQISPGLERHHLAARHAIEWGRVLNSEGDPTSARPFFERALREATVAGAEGLAIDALHMIAIVEGGLGGPSQSREWNEKALIRARQSEDPDARRWQASLLNNLGWDHLDSGDAIGALALFEEALVERRQSGNAELIQIAEEAVAEARTLLGQEPTSG
ncbi:MAG TPA: tetratricopeptide repeat protein [Acidimicrobiia bacterium]|nr:tetratricopeptide repeat protein [Acidimicrobiia bacterium]